VSDGKLFCYCFEIPLDEARADLEACASKIRQRIAIDGCWCDRANPSGKCCLSQTHQLETGTQVPAVTAVTAGLGAAALATAASACCVPLLAPLLVTVFGVGGSIWAAGLAPYSLWIVLLSGAALGWAGWTVYRPREVHGVRCHARPRPILHIAFWLAVALWLVALGVNLMSKLGGAAWLMGLAS
jgi:hypothetical protein